MVIKNPSANAGEERDLGSIPGLGRSPGGGNGNPLMFLPGESHGQRSLVGYSPWDRKESDTRFRPRMGMNEIIVSGRETSKMGECA